MGGEEDTVEKVMKPFLKGIGDFANSFRSLFAFYILMYLAPLIIPFGLVTTVWGNIFIDKKEVNFVILKIISSCSAIVIAWTLFFLIYLTRERTKNPKLYGKGFIEGFDEATETIDSSESKDLVQENTNRGGAE